MLKGYGIGVTVVRAGKYKALANGVEKLSEEGKAQIQASVDSAYKIFVDHVAEMRGKSYEFADSVMAQGREFYGQAAADAGLIDAVKSVDEVLSAIQEKLMDTSKSFMDNRGGQAKGLRVETQGDATMAKKTLTEQDIAALAAGAQLGASVSPAAPQADGGDDPAQEAKKEEVAADEAKAPEATKEAAKEDVTSMTAIKVLSDQLKAAQDELMSARLAHAKLDDKHNELLAVVGPLKDIAVSAMNNMRVALNASALDMAASTPAQVVAEYASVKANFVKQFPVGGVAAVDAVETTEKKADVDPYYRDRVAAVR